MSINFLACLKIVSVESPAFITWKFFALFHSLNNGWELEILPNLSGGVTFNGPLCCLVFILKKNSWTVTRSNLLSLRVSNSFYLFLLFFNVLFYIRKSLFQWRSWFCVVTWLQIRISLAFKCGKAIDKRRRRRENPHLSASNDEETTSDLDSFNTF